MSAAIMRGGLGFGVSLWLAGCATPGGNLAPNVYNAGEVDQRMEARIVTILTVTPAKVEVSNEQNRQSAQLLGGLLGAIGGGVLGNSTSHSEMGGTLLGGTAGGAVGLGAGSLVESKTLVDGVSLAYEDSGHTYNSAQVGRVCEFAPGKATVIVEGPSKTRVQPNAACQVATKS